MITETQLSEIRKYLLSKKLPIDILLEVQDHFVSQISDLMMDENFSFEDAFEKTKENWQEDLTEVYPWFVINKTPRAARTQFEMRLKRTINFNVLKISFAIVIFFMIAVLILSRFIPVETFTKILWLFLMFVIVLFFSIFLYIFISNKNLFGEKFKNVRFSIYQWRVFLIFSFGYFGLDYLKPMKDWVNKLYAFEFDANIILKTIIYISLCISFIFSGIIILRFSKVMKRLKENITFV